MIKFKILTAALAIMGGASFAFADDTPTDVTSTYISNPGFESCPAITANQVTGSNIDYAANGWTSTSDGAQSCGAVVDYGSEYTLNTIAAPDSDNDGNSGKTLGISVGWEQLVTYKTVNVTLSPGYYTFKVNVFNNNSNATTFYSKIGFISESGIEYLSTTSSFAYNSWLSDEVSFCITENTTGYFQIGGKAKNAKSTENAIVFFDNLNSAAL